MKQIEFLKCGFERVLVVSILSASVMFVMSCKQNKPAELTKTSPTPAVTKETPATTSAKVTKYQGTGVVTKVVKENPYDKSIASIELNHGEIVGLMPPMIMEFNVKDKALLEGIKVGDMVDFTIEEAGGMEIISEIKKN